MAARVQAGQVRYWPETDELFVASAGQTMRRGDLS